MLAFHWAAGLESIAEEGDFILSGNKGDATEILSGEVGWSHPFT